MPDHVPPPPSYIKIPGLSLYPSLRLNIMSSSSAYLLFDNFSLILLDLIQSTKTTNQELELKHKLFDGAKRFQTRNKLSLYIVFQHGQTMTTIISKLLKTPEWKKAKQKQDVCFTFSLKQTCVYSRHVAMRGFERVCIEQHEDVTQNLKHCNTKLD